MCCKCHHTAKHLKTLRSRKCGPCRETWGPTVTRPTKFTAFRIQSLQKLKPSEFHALNIHFFIISAFIIQCYKVFSEPLDNSSAPFEEPAWPIPIPSDIFSYSPRIRIDPFRRRPRIRRTPDISESEHRPEWTSWFLSLFPNPNI